MNEDILALLQSQSASFSKGQRRIAAYITESYDKAAFMTANRLGKAVGVSESTVVRFAVELGYDGYPSMQKALQEMVMNRLTSVQRLGVANDLIGDQDVISMVIRADMEKLRQTNETVNRGDFQAAVSAILNARRIYVLGVRSASALTNFMVYYLNYMFDNVTMVTNSGCNEMFEHVVSVEASDVVIAFSFPRYSTATIKGVQYCRSVGAQVVGLTNSRVSPLAQNSDYVLVAKSDMVSLIDSLVAPLSLVNALLVALAARREQALQKSLNTLERVWEEYNVYEKRTGSL